MSFFVYDNETKTEMDRNPETQNTVRRTEFVPRNLPSLEDKSWEDIEFLAKALGIQIGKECRHTDNGTEVRDVFFTKVQGEMSPSGRNYPWLRIGVLYSGVKQDKETGKPKRWHSFEPEAEAKARRAARAGGAPSESTPTNDDQAKQAEASVNSI